MRRTRFAPSPTGPLHLGHAYAALIAHARGDEMVLRIEDIDQSRARPHWEAAIYEDLDWLGLAYIKVPRQSERQAAYDAALDTLWAKGLLYPCTCNRRDIQAAASAPQEGAPLRGPDGIIYPGTCRPSAPPSGPRPRDQALRLNMERAATEALQFDETGPAYAERHRIMPERFITQIGDVALARRDMGASYHLSVVMDDADQGITEITRGEDLFEATPIHVLLQRLLGLPTPRYHHHALIRDEQGKRLAKRDDARALRLYREAGWDPTALLAHLRAEKTTPPRCP